MRGSFSLLWLLILGTGCSAANKPTAVNEPPQATVSALFETGVTASPTTAVNTSPSTASDITSSVEANTSSQSAVVDTLLPVPTEPPTKYVPEDSNESTRSSSRNTPIGAVATNLVSTIVQLAEFPPLATTIQYADKGDQFGTELVAALKKSGYGIQMVTDDQGLNYLEYSKMSIWAPEGSSVTKFSVSIRGITVTREFLLSNKGYVPISGLEIVGSNPQPISLVNNTDLQTAGSPNSPNRIIFISDQGRIQKITSGSAGNKLSKPKSLDRSTELAVKTFRPQKHLVMRFIPGSLELGEKNKQAIRSLMAKFSRSKNRIIITSCDERSLEWDGTLETAMNRGLRINKELLTLEVPVDNIRIESCSNPRYQSNLVKNSAVITYEISDNSLYNSL